jgi:hypothetical protein
MTVSQLDRSNYYKGLLVLSGSDRIIDPRERELMLQLGRLLDFDRRFCEAAIDDLLDNKYITDEPVTFSTREIAECFLLDAIRFALVDDQLHSQEMAWLKAVARANGFTNEWLDAEVQSCEKKSLVDLPSTLAIRKHLS